MDALSRDRPAPELWRYGIGATVFTSVVVGALALLARGFGSISGYMPHGHCYLWKPPLLALHVASDIAIAAAYFAISMTLVYLVRRARGDIPFHWMIMAFGGFIVACGATHLMEVWTAWHANYWLSGGVKLFTAAISVTTAIALPPLVPRILTLVRADRIARDQQVRLAEESRRLAEAEAAGHALEAAREEAVAASSAKDQFLAMVSHELRNPLSPILIWARMLRRGEVDPGQGQRALDVIERNAQLLAQLIDDLLDVSRIVSGKLSLDMRPVELGSVIEATLEAVRPLAEPRQIGLEVVIDPAAGMVAGDPARLQQVLWNLVSNAIKFTANGGQVHIGLASRDTDVEIRVSDTGIGIPPDALPYVFDRFWQAETGRPEQRSGLGLGLAIVRHVIELHGGTVSVHSEGEHKGATFVIRLPRLDTPRGTQAGGSSLGTRPKTSSRVGS